jgi:hypothetical protein
VAEAHRRFTAAQASHAERERRRQQQLDAAHASYRQAVAGLQAQHARDVAVVARLWSGLAANEPAAVAAYFELVLTAKGGQGVFPPTFPQRFQVAYTPGFPLFVAEGDWISAASAFGLHPAARRAGTLTVRRNCNKSAVNFGRSRGTNGRSRSPA